MRSPGSLIPRVLLPALTASCLTFVVFLTTVVNTSLVRGQTVPKPADRRKNFGKSLKKFEEKRTDLPARTAVGGGETVDVLTIDTDLVVIDALVVNEKGKAILGLNSGDFIVI